MNKDCRFSNTNDFGPCQGEILMHNDNRRTTFDCERHARLMTAWIDITKWQKPAKHLSDFLRALNADGMRDFEKKMSSVSLKNIYVPLPPQR